MNRRSAAAYDSDDSASDWDTTVADSPTRENPLKPSFPAATPAITTNTEPDAIYATVTAKPRTSLKGSGDEASSNIISNGKSHASNLNGDTTKPNDLSTGMASPPPHLTSFKNALTNDRPESPEVAPSVPPKRFNTGIKGQLYTVPEADLGPQVDVSNWDDSDAEERVLKEIQRNLGKEKQRQQQQQQSQQSDGEGKSRERKVTLAAPGDPSPSPSPKVSRLDKWRQHKSDVPTSIMKKSETSLLKKDERQGPPYSSHAALEEAQPAVVKLHHSSHSKADLDKTVQPMFVRDNDGKRYVFYFEEGSPHFVEVEEDDVEAFLPNRVEEIERLFRRVWREVFAVLRVFTSFFVLFLSELLRFLLHSVVRRLVLDSVIAVGDQLVKPLLTAMFNVIFQPLLALTWNVCNAAFQAVDPVLRMSGVVLSQLAMVVGAFRLVVVNHNPPANYSQEVNVV